MSGASYGGRHALPCIFAGSARATLLRRARGHRNRPSQRFRESLHVGLGHVAASASRRRLARDAAELLHAQHGAPARHRLLLLLLHLLLDPVTGVPLVPLDQLIGRGAGGEGGGQAGGAAVGRTCSGRGRRRLLTCRGRGSRLPAMSVVRLSEYINPFGSTGRFLGQSNSLWNTFRSASAGGGGWVAAVRWGAGLDI